MKVATAFSLLIFLIACSSGDVSPTFNLPIREIYTDPTTGETFAENTYTYTFDGKIASEYYAPKWMDDAARSKVYTYNFDGDLSMTREGYPMQSTFTVTEMTYRNHQLISDIKYSESPTSTEYIVGHQYFYANGKLESVGTFSYPGNDRNTPQLTTTSYYTYRNSGREVLVTTEKNSTFGVIYTYDDKMNLLSQCNTDNGYCAAINEYDNQGRKTKVSYQMGDTQYLLEELFYEGNRLTKKIIHWDPNYTYQFDTQVSSIVKYEYRN